MDQQKIGLFIARRRKELNLTQKELADKLGITDRAVSKWENGRCMPDLSLLQPLSRILRVGVNDLLSGELIPEEKVWRIWPSLHILEISGQGWRVFCRFLSSCLYTAV